MKKLKYIKPFKSGKRIESYQSFREGFWSKLIGSDKKKINEGVKRLQNMYNELKDSEKKEFTYILERCLSTISENNYISYSSKELQLISKYKDAFDKILDTEDWYSIVDPSSDDGEHLIGIIEKIAEALVKQIPRIKEIVSKAELKKKKDDYEKEYAKLNSVADKINWNLGQKPDYWSKLFACIPGSPGYNMDASKEVFLYAMPLYGNHLFLETEKFKEFEKWVNGLENELKVKWSNDEIIDYKDFFDKMKASYNDLVKSVASIIQPEYRIPNLSKFNEILKWVKSELKDKNVSDIALSLSTEKIIEITRSDSKETKNEGDRLIAGNIVYTGQCFNNLNKENISNFINKEGVYKETASGKGIYTTNNIPYAFYYCHLRFELENQKVSDTLFPTVYKIVLKPGTKFFYREDTHISKDEMRLVLMSGISGFHSGNEIVNDQSIEISIFNTECIESIEAIPTKDLIAYLDSPELSKDNRWIKADRFKINQNDISWYKSLVQYSH